MPLTGNDNFTITKELNDGIKNLLGKYVRILIKSPVKLEGKSDKTENRVLVLCPCRLFCVKIPHLRIDFHFHYLELQSLESKKPNQLILTANEKSYSFIFPDPELEMIDKMIVTLLTAIKDTFPGIPLGSLIRKVDVVPASRLTNLDLFIDSNSSILNDNTRPNSANSSLICPKSKSTTSLSDEASSLMNSLSTSSGIGESGSNGGRSSASPSNFSHLNIISKWGTTAPCGGFSTQYAWMCDLLGLPYRDEVAWDVDTIYLSHDCHELCLRDFDHLEPRDSLPILSALEYNTWFKGLRLSNTKMSHEAIERLLHVIRKSSTIEEIFMDNIGVKTDFVVKLSSALNHNSKCQVHTLDLSHNMIEDKGAIQLSNSISKFSRGPNWLNFSHCGFSSKGVAQLAQALALNRFASTNLSHLNLSGNSLKDDINSLCNFLAQPNVVAHLDLSGTDCTLEAVFGALLRGCTTQLATLNLSKNNFASKKGKEIPPSFKQFLTSSLALKHLSLSSCKISLEGLKQLLLGLACNESAADVELDLSSNSIGSQGAVVLESCLPGIRCLSSLDISDNNLETELGVIICAANKNKSLKHFNVSKNLQSTKPKHVAQVMESIVHVLQDEDCVLASLSIADSKLKNELFNVINALGSNHCLQNLNISGNQMGDVGARLLAKALQINSKLNSIIYDKNNISLQGFSDIAYGLESNTSVRYMPFPIHDINSCMKVSAERTENVMKKIQELIFRNSQPKKASNGHKALRLQQGFLLSSAQQTIDKLIAQTQDSIKQLRKSNEDGRSLDVMTRAQIEDAENILSDSENAKQLVLNLHEILQPKGEPEKMIDLKLHQISDDLHVVLSQYVEGSIEQIINATEEKCSNILSSESREKLKDGCLKKHKISSDFTRHSIIDSVGSDVIGKFSEVHLAVASHISEKLVDAVIDSLIKCLKELNELTKKKASPPDLVKTKLESSPNSREISDHHNIVFGDNSHLSDQSPMATPQMHGKRRGYHQGRRIRPKSVVDSVEGISADDIPDLLPSLPRTIEETISNLIDLPMISPQQLKHLGKARPKKPKSRAPTRAGLRQPESAVEVRDLQQGLDTFFRPGSTTPTTVVTPDSDECSTSLMISSITSVVEDAGLLSTPTHSSRTFKADENNSEKTSPSSFDSCSIGSKLSLEAVPRSKSTDCLQKPGSSASRSLQVPSANATNSTTQSEAHIQRDSQSSPIPKLGISVGSSVLAEMKARQEKRSSTIIAPAVEALNTESEDHKSSVAEVKEKFSKNSSAALISKRPQLAPKPRPWSVVGADRRSGEYSLGSDGSSPNASSANTPDSGEILEDGGIIETVSVQASVSNIVATGSVSSVISSNPKDISRVTFDTGSSSRNASGLLSSSPGKLHVDPSQDKTGPTSLPNWTLNGNKNGPGISWSVKEMAASLARQQTQQAEEKAKKSESLPRNASPPTTTNFPAEILKPLTTQSQELSRARVSVQEWNRSHSVGEWKSPLKKLTTEFNSRSVSKRWGISSEEKS